MAKAVVMPKAGITVETCVIGEWRKKPGDKVAVGDILFDYETDKASFECESTAEGTLLEVFFENGDEVPVLVNVCAVGAPGEDVSSLRPAEATAAEHKHIGKEKTNAAAAALAAERQAPAAAPTASGEDGIFRISPRARGLAERSGMNPESAVATGPAGRVVEADIRRLMNAVTAETASTAPAESQYEDVKFSYIRRVIAKTMKESLESGAQLTNNHSFDASSIKRCRTEFKAAGGDLAEVTIGDMVLFAVSRTLKNHPDLNAVIIDENTIRHYKDVNLSVAIDTPRGLMVPVIFGADKKTLVQISKEVKELAAAARSGSISPDLLKGGSFTVSNLGALGVESFTPVINPPQTGILGVCCITQRAREKEGGGYEFYPAMGLSLTYDHRAVDGAPAARFMKELCSNLESFTALLVKG
jgi:pyruvate dehydrogenase E2 component (dihydrolipoamide acetyltransferase)